MHINQFVRVSLTGDGDMVLRGNTPSRFLNFLPYDEKNRIISHQFSTMMRIFGSFKGEGKVPRIPAFAFFPDDPGCRNFNEIASAQMYMSGEFRLGGPNSITHPLFVGGNIGIMNVNDTVQVSLTKPGIDFLVSQEVESYQDRLKGTRYTDKLGNIMVIFSHGMSYLGGYEQGQEPLFVGDTVHAWRF